MSSCERIVAPIRLSVGEHWGRSPRVRGAAALFGLRGICFAGLLLAEVVQDRLYLSRLHDRVSHRVVGL